MWAMWIFAWAGGQLSPSRYFRRRRRTDRHLRLQPRHTYARRHFEFFQHLTRLRVDPPQVALVAFGSGMPELAIDPCRRP